jgi:hypothetical protein
MLSPDQPTRFLYLPFRPIPKWSLSFRFSNSSSARTGKMCDVWYTWQTSCTLYAITFDACKLQHFLIGSFLQPPVIPSHPYGPIVLCPVAWAVPKNSFKPHTLSNMSRFTWWYVANLQHPYTRQTIKLEGFQAPMWTCLSDYSQLSSIPE